MTVSFPGRSGRDPAPLAMFDELVTRIPKANGNITSALLAMTGGYRDLINQRMRIEKDETATAGAKVVKAARAARKMIPFLEALDSARETAAQHAAQLRQQVEHTYNPPNPTYPTCMRHQEIRTLFRTLPAPERHALLEQARQSGDRDTLLAIASCQPYLSGVDPKLHEFTRNEIVRATAPEQADKLKMLAEQDQLAEMAREHMVQSVADMVDFQRAEEIEAAAREDVAV